MTRILALIAALVLAAPAVAQVFPTRSETPVTDDADLLPPVDEARLAERLVALRQETGATIEVVTLLSGALYTMGEETADYARMLAAEWDLAAQSGGRSILLLVISEDREIAIDLGAGFGEGETATAQSIITETIAPAFREDAYPAGIANGVEAVARQILGVTPPATETPAAPAGDGAGGGGALWWLVALLGLPVAGVMALRRRSAAKLAATPCPSCGKTGLTQSRVTLSEATETREGQGEVRTSCPHCGNTTSVPFTIPKKSSQTQTGAKPGKGGKGGGTASGGW